MINTVNLSYETQVARRTLPRGMDHDNGELPAFLDLFMSETRTISLSQGLVTVVNDEDYEYLMIWTWHAIKSDDGSMRGARLRSRSERRRDTAKGRMVWIHRAIMVPEPGMVVDHINHNTLDNRRCNLRVCTVEQNMQNKRVTGNGTSIYKGVYRDYGKWIAHISTGNRHTRLGQFDNQVDAALAYNKAAAEHFGEFACLNVIEPGAEDRVHA